MCAFKNVLGHQSPSPVGVQSVDVTFSVVGKPFKERYWRASHSEQLHWDCIL